MASARFSLDVPELTFASLPLRKRNKKLNYRRDSAHLRSLRFSSSFKVIDFDLISVERPYVASCQ